MSFLFSGGLFDVTPDSVVSRTADNGTFNGPTGAFGLQIETNVTWPEIGGELSNNTSSATRAYVYRVSDANLMGDVDISGLTGGDTFTIALNNNLISGETYNFVLDAEGAGWNVGLYNSPSFPITSSDGNLSIVNGARDEASTGPNTEALARIGYVGF